MAREFVTSIKEGRPPLSDGHAGLRVVRMLEAAQESIEHNGRVIYLKDPIVRHSIAPSLPELEIPYAGGSHAGILSNRA
jgi:hypothetical protein